MIMRVDILILTLTGLLMTAGCSTAPQQKILRDMPVSEEGVVQIPVRPTVANNAEYHGSLFRKTYSMQLFSDRRAYRVGDILTVKLEDGTRITTDSNTTMDKRSTADVADPVIFGRTGAEILGGRNSLALNIAPNRNFTGNTAISRGYNIQSGYVTVQVTEVMGNGALRVKGEKWLKLNNEAEFVRLSGLVRPEDIDPNNEVSSRRLAETKITYSGVGYQESVHEPGWLMKLINSPLFPF